MAEKKEERESREAREHERRLAAGIPHQKSQEAVLARDEAAKLLNLAARPVDAEGKPLTGKEKASHYVVTHGAIGSTWKEHDVIPAEALGTQVSRLEMNGAIRPATDEEAERWKGAGQAAPAKGFADLSPEEQVAELTRLLKAQADLVSRYAGELTRAHQAQTDAGKAPPPGWIDPKLVAEKDKTIGDLQRQLVQLRHQLQEQEQEAGDKAGESSRKASEQAAHPAHGGGHGGGGGAHPTGPAKR